MNWFLEAFKKYDQFNSRSGREEFWFFVLFNILFGAVCSFIDSFIGLVNFGYGLGLFSLIYLLVSFLPSLAVSIRRLHDTGKSGWWCLLYFIPFGVLVLIYFLVQPSESGSNQYGARPK